MPVLLKRLEKIDVREIEKAHFDLISDLIRKKKFARYLIKGKYPVAMDGTGKHWVKDSELITALTSLSGMVFIIKPDLLKESAQASPCP